MYPLSTMIIKRNDCFRIMILTMLLVLFAGFETACADQEAPGNEFPYCLENPGKWQLTLDVLTLENGDIVAGCQHNQYEKVIWRWWKNGRLYRELTEQLQEVAGARSYRLKPLARSEAQCGFVRIIQSEENALYRIELYDWQQDGLVLVKSISERTSHFPIIGPDCFGLFVLNDSQRTIFLYDDNGDLKQILEIPHGVLFRLKRDGENSWLVTARGIDDSQHMHYLHMLIRDQKIVWQLETDKELALYPDGLGGLYYFGEQDAYQYVLVRLDREGTECWRTNMSTDRVLLCWGKANIRFNPNTDITVLTGSAVANSRKIYNSFQIHLDKTGQCVAYDLRNSDYHSTIYYEVYPGGTRCADLILFYDSKYAPAAVPFEALPHSSTDIGMYIY